jgi:hypothetical protein
VLLEGRRDEDAAPAPAVRTASLRQVERLDGEWSPELALLREAGRAVEHRELAEPFDALA